jgi:hypothetical protein
LRGRGGQLSLEDGGIRWESLAPVAGGALAGRASWLRGDSLRDSQQSSGTSFFTITLFAWPVMQITYIV